MDFTNEEKHRIDLLYGTDFKGELTSDDIDLIRRFEQCRAETNAEINAHIELMQAETRERIKQNRETATLARDILRKNAEKAKQRLEMMRYGKEE